MVRKFRVLPAVTILAAILFFAQTQLIESGVTQGDPLQYTLQGLTRSPMVTMTNGSLGGWNEDEWVPFRLVITNTGGDAQVTEAAINLEYENSGSYGIDAFAACFAESAECGSGRTPQVGPGAVGSGTLWRLLVDTSEQTPTVSFETLPGGVKTIQWRLGELNVPAVGSLSIRWAVHLARGNSTNLACTGDTPLGECSPQGIPVGKGEASWPGRSLQVRAASPIPGERTVSIDVAQGGRGCLVATAAYGSDMAPEVACMRHVRDEMIGSSRIGGLLVGGWNAFYYSWSPSVAEIITENSQVAPIFRFMLIPLVWTIHVTAFTYAVLACVDVSLASVISFLVAVSLSLLSYVIIPSLTLVYICRRGVRRFRAEI